MSPYPYVSFLDHGVITLRCKSVEPNLAVLAEIHEAFGVRLQSEWHTVRFRSIALPKEGEIMPRKTVMPFLGKAPDGCEWTLKRVQHGGIMRGPRGFMYTLSVIRGGKNVYKSQFFVGMDDDAQAVITAAARQVLAEL